MNEKDKGTERNPDTPTKISITISPTVKGIAAMIIGALLLLGSYKMILHIACFTGGLFLIYYGLVALHIKQVTDYVDWTIEKIKSLFVKH